jgi:hypothetical protein
VRRRLLATWLLVVPGLVLVELAPAVASQAERWTPLQPATDHTVAVALADGTAALISIGGDDDATIYDQRRAADGSLGTPTEVTTVDGAEDCRPVEAATALSNVAVAVECFTQTGLDDPPMRLAALVWTAAGGWTWQVHFSSTLSSLDYSPDGQYVVFTSKNRYGRPHHLTSYHAEQGWRDVRRREIGPAGDDLVAAVTDDGDLYALRGAGFEDEPGYWWGGRLAIFRYDASRGEWARLFARSYPDGGIRPVGVDIAGGRVFAAVVRSRSTGALHGLEDKLVALSGNPRNPRVWKDMGWVRDVLAADAAITSRGVGVVGWQQLDEPRSVRPHLTTWAPQRQPTLYHLPWPTTPTDAAGSGRAMDLSVSANGSSAVAVVRHRQGSPRSAVAAAAFKVRRDGAILDSVDATWRRQPVDTTVQVVASASTASATLGRMRGPFVTLPQVRLGFLP